MRTNRLFNSGLYTAAVLSFAAYSTAVFALTELQNIRVSPLSGDQLELQFDFNEPVTTFTDKLKYQPNQLYLNFPATSSALRQNSIPIERLGIQDILVKPKNAGLDVSVNLERLMPYLIKQDGSHISVTLGQSLANDAKPQATSTSKLVTTPTASSTPISRLSSWVRRSCASGRPGRKARSSRAASTASWTSTPAASSSASTLPRCRCAA